MAIFSKHSKHNNMSKLQTLEVTRQEALLLKILLTGSLVTLETEYQKNKEDDSFLKEDALSEITALKGLKNKIDKLEL